MIILIFISPYLHLNLNKLNKQYKFSDNTKVVVFLSLSTFKNNKRQR